MAANRLKVFQFPCRDDNYGVILHDPDGDLVISIDAPELEPIEDVLQSKNLDLSHILTTHKHPDHVAGNEALKAKYGCWVIGPADEADNIPGLDQSVSDGEQIELNGHRIDVLGAPGHTLGQIVYSFPDQKLLFPADALFALGCGRLFEGTPAMMHETLQRFAQLPDDTSVYAGHEYTLANARFAVSVDPDNEELAARAREIELLRDDGKPTLPTSIGLEKRTNPFMRPHDPAIRQQLGMADASDVDVFAEIRARKDRF